MNILSTLDKLRIFILILAITLLMTPVYSQIPGMDFLDEDEDEIEIIGNDMCIDCHDEEEHGTDFEEDISYSIHEDITCLECHPDMNTDPHPEEPDFNYRCQGCGDCHEEEFEEYKGHGRFVTGECEDLPNCVDCHGGHDILEVDDENSLVNPLNLPKTCGSCHEDINMTTKYQILINKPIEIYETSVHAAAVRDGDEDAPTCNDCHSTNGTAHQIYHPGKVNSTINYFNIPHTCGKCHEEEEEEYWEGIHGQLTARGETDSPVCTKCHGEHGILSPSDPNSPVSQMHVAEAICAPCHDAPLLNEKYGLPPGKLHSYIDSYHGLKTKAGDTDVATCGSCHGKHRILSSTDSTSTTFKGNLVQTCGECHEGITEKVAQAPIHGVSEEGLHTPIARLVEKIYILAIIIIIGLMVVHWIIDLFRQIVNVTRKPQVRRMQKHEVWQHTFLMVSFTILALSGFALRFHQSWIATFLFGWEGGFIMRGLVHRIAAIIFIITTVWHTVFILLFPRGRVFLKDMVPNLLDFKQFIARIKYNLKLSEENPRFKRFSYIEKAEYWALVWGTAVMIITGIFLWFDNYFSIFFPKGVLDVSLVVHYWEAWLATLAILVWHLYSTIFNPHTYPMNPSWMTGKMPKDMYEKEHPEHLEEAIKEEKELLRKEMDTLGLSRSDIPPRKK